MGFLLDNPDMARIKWLGRSFNELKKIDVSAGFRFRTMVKNRWMH
jgi:hypothetical protein